MSELLNHLNQAHSHLESVFNANINKDIKLARELEQLLNYIIYDKDTSLSSNSLWKALNNTARQNLKNNNNLKHLFSLQGGLAGEEAFASAIAEIIQGIEPKLNQQITNNIKDFIIGDQQATIVSQRIAKNAAQELKRQIDKDLKNISIKEYSSWKARMGKIDVDFSSIEIEGKIHSKAKQLLNITASIKNYSSFRVSLEKVNKKKAYLAIMSEAKPKLEKKGLEDLWKIYQIERKNNDPIVETHIQHLINVYALTGYGQTYINKAKQELERKFARFLMLNNIPAQEIKIQSTKKIVVDTILRGDSAGFASRITSSNKYHITYTM